MQSDGTNTLEFIYDGNGLCGVKCNNENYLYRKNAQGDITHILDNAGMVVAKYVYDAWGNHAILDANGTDLASGVGVLNPFRYRSYYYDEETDLYYLQTRYYDPEVGRFLSQDDVSYLAPDSINGLNLYAYCGNNPVMNVDPTGRFVSTILGTIFGALWGAVSALMNGEDVLKGLAAGALSGFLNGIALDVSMAITALIPGGIGIVIGLGVAVVGGFLMGTLGDAAGQLITGSEKIDWAQALTVGGITAITNLFSFGISVLAGNAVGKSTANLIKMLLPEYTPGWSWAFQAIMTWVLPFFPMIPNFSKPKNNKLIAV